MRQIDIFRKKLHAIQIPTVFPKPYAEARHTHTHTHTHTGIVSGGAADNIVLTTKAPRAECCCDEIVL
jgi:hypothetical protein